MKTRGGYLLVFLLFLSACVANPNSVKALTDSSNKFLSSESEQKLIAQSDQAHQEFIKQGLIVDDPSATAYLESIAEKFLPSIQHGPTLHYYILKDANLNAMALPNGNIYVNAGLLVKLESEDQLALVLAHETAHVIQRHSYKGSLDRHNTVVAAHITDLLLGGTGIAYTPFVMNLVSFSREQEKEADLEGLRYLSTTRYDLEDSIKVFDKLAVVKYSDHSSSVWSDHPALIERKEYSSRYVNALNDKDFAPPLVARYEVIRRKMADLVINLYLLNGQYELATDAADHEISRQGEAAVWHSYKGDAKRDTANHPEYAAKEYAWLHNKRFDATLTENFSKKSLQYLQVADDEYRQALKINSNFSPAIRGIGLTALSRGDNNDAREYLQRYLSMAHNPDDKLYIQNLLIHIRQ